MITGDAYDGFTAFDRDSINDDRDAQNGNV
jgi:hypothetical protein